MWGLGAELECGGRSLWGWGRSLWAVRAELLGCGGGACRGRAWGWRAELLRCGCCPIELPHKRVLPHRCALPHK